MVVEYGASTGRVTCTRSRGWRGSTSEVVRMAFVAVAVEAVVGVGVAGYVAAATDTVAVVAR